MQKAIVHLSSRHLHPFLWIILLTILASCPLAAQSTYTVKPRDTVYGIAREHKMSKEDLYKLNPDLRTRSLRSGEVIRIAPRILPASSIPHREPAASVGGGQVKNTTLHRVQKGETLSSIGRTYGVSVKDLVRVNPEISPDNLPEGFRLVIPISTATWPNKKTTQQKPLVSEGSQPAQPRMVDKAPVVFGDMFGLKGKIDTVRLSLILPLGAEDPERYVRFYEGFLMGLNDLKKGGISLILHTYNADSKAEVQKILNSGALVSEHLIIGGVSEEGIDLLSAYSRKRGQPYVVPFNSSTDASLAAPSVFQVNAPQEYLYSSIASEFVRLYRGHKVYFVGDRSAPTEPIIAPIVEKLKQGGAAYSYINIEDVVRVEPSAVIVPLNSDKQSLLSIIDRLAATSTAPQIFGYPVWQTYDRATIAKMGKYTATIYSTFFFNESDPETSLFATKYNAWYSHPIAAGYPKYSVLGYDIARYFIRAIASYGIDFASSLAMIPSDGLQTDFSLLQPSGRGGYINANVFFVTYKPMGPPQRRSLFR